MIPDFGAARVLALVVFALRLILPADTRLAIAPLHRLSEYLDP